MNEEKQKQEVKILNEIIEKEKWNESYHLKELTTARVRILAAMQMLNELTSTKDEAK